MAAHSVHTAAWRSRRRAEVDAPERRPVRVQRAHRPRPGLAEVERACVDVTTEEVAVACLEVGGRRHCAGEDQVAEAGRETLDLRLDRQPEFARGIIRELTKLNIALTRKLTEARGQRVDVRIAQLFLALSARMGKEVDGGIDIPLQLSRQEIADLVGTTVESAIRVMSRWGRENLVVTREKGFFVPSREKLAAVLESPDEP